MMEDPYDPKRPLKYSEYPRSRLSDDRYASWGMPALILLFLVIVGVALFSGTGDKPTTTASNNQSPITHNVPVQTPAPMPPQRGLK